MKQEERKGKKGKKKGKQEGRKEEREEGRAEGKRTGFPGRGGGFFSDGLVDDSGGARAREINTTREDAFSRALARAKGARRPGINRTPHSTGGEAPK